MLKDHTRHGLAAGEDAQAHSPQALRSESGVTACLIGGWQEPALLCNPLPHSGRLPVSIASDRPVFWDEQILRGGLETLTAA